MDRRISLSSSHVRSERYETAEPVDTRTPYTHPHTLVPGEEKNAPLQSGAISTKLLNDSDVKYEMREFHAKYTYGVCTTYVHRME